MLFLFYNDNIKLNILMTTFVEDQTKGFVFNQYLKKIQQRVLKEQREKK
jgi:hypothetical protein